MWALFLAFLVGGYVGHLYGWRIAFMMAGLPPLLLALLLRLAVPEAPVAASAAPRRKADPSPSSAKCSAASGADPGAAADPDRRDSRHHGGLWGARLDPVLSRSLAWILTSRKPGPFSPSSSGLGVPSAPGSAAISATAWARVDIRWSLWLVAIMFVVARPFCHGVLLGQMTRLWRSTLFVLAGSGRHHPSRPIGRRAAWAHRPASAPARLGAFHDDRSPSSAWGLVRWRSARLSALVFARYGEDSLRYALLVWQCVGFWAADPLLSSRAEWLRVRVAGPYPKAFVACSAEFLAVIGGRNPQAAPRITRRNVAAEPRPQRCAMVLGAS